MERRVRAEPLVGVEAFEDALRAVEGEGAVSAPTASRVLPFGKPAHRVARRFQVALLADERVRQHPHADRMPDEGRVSTKPVEFVAVSIDRAIRTLLRDKPISVCDDRARSYSLSATMPSVMDYTLLTQRPRASSRGKRQRKRQRIPTCTRWTSNTRHRDRQQTCSTNGHAKSAQICSALTPCPAGGAQIYAHHDTQSRRSGAPRSR